jgi:hypothetical protein
MMNSHRRLVAGIAAVTLALGASVGTAIGAGSAKTHHKTATAAAAKKKPSAKASKAKTKKATHAKAVKAKPKFTG